MKFLVVLLFVAAAARADSLGDGEAVQERSYGGGYVAPPVYSYPRTVVDKIMVKGFSALRVEGSYVVKVVMHGTDGYGKDGYDAADHENKDLSYHTKKNDGAWVEITSEAKKHYDLVDVVVDYGTLIIRPKYQDNYADHYSRVEIVVHAYYLRQIEGQGSAWITVEGSLVCKNVKLIAGGSTRITTDVQATKLVSEIAGAGVITVSGYARVAIININGAGVYNAFDLRTEITVIQVYGSGDLSINASRKITGYVQGAVIMQYLGKPMIKVNVDGYKKFIAVEKNDDGKYVPYQGIA